MTNQAQLKTRLLKLRENLKAYACHGIGERYRVAAGYYNGWNPPSENGARWVENLASAGLRFHAFADKAARMDHTGWYADEFYDSLYCGVVLQMPARHGKPQFLAGYQVFEGGKREAQRVEGVRVDVAAGVFENEEDAARAADSFAQRESEAERTYQEAFSMGSKWAELGHEIEAERKEVRDLLGEVKAGGKTLPPLICKTLRSRVKTLRASIQEAAQERRKLADASQYNGWWLGKYGPAFNDAAGAKVLPV